MGDGLRGCGPKSITKLVASARGYIPSANERAEWRQLVEALAARRRALGMSQNELDARLGLSDGYVAKWESYQRLPGAFMMHCWTCALGSKLVIARRG